jgi:hypothetical protein
LDVAAVHNILETLPPEAIDHHPIEWFTSVYCSIAEYAYQGDGIGEEPGDWDTREVRDVFDNEVLLTANGELEQATLDNWKGDWRNKVIRLPLEGGYESLGNDAASLTPYDLVHPGLFQGEEGTLIRHLFEQLGAKVLSTAELLASASEDSLADLEPARIFEAYADHEDVDPPATQWLRNVPNDGFVADRFVEYLRENDGVEPDDVDGTIQSCVIRHWRRLSNETKRQTLRYLMTIEDTEDIELANINSLPNKQGRWIDPSKLVFPDEYNPKYDFETLADAYPEVFSEHTGGFVDPVLIVDDPSACRDLLQDVGVCASLNEQQNIVSTLSGYVGQAYVSQRFNEEDVELVETDTHGENAGWDLKDAEGNYYEIKSTASTQHGEIEIEGRQFRELSQSLESDHEYYVVAIINSLGENICIEDCATAREIMNVKESITYTPEETDEFNSI